jgi:phage tail tape-measure protein
MAHAIAARAKASINRPLRPGDRGGSGGRGRERGGLTEGAVVVTLTVILVAELPGVTGFGETVQVASEGAPVQVKVRLWPNPLSPATLKV